MARKRIHPRPPKKYNPSAEELIMIKLHSSAEEEPVDLLNNAPLTPEQLSYGRSYTRMYPFTTRGYIIRRNRYNMYMTGAIKIALKPRTPFFVESKPWGLSLRTSLLEIRPRINLFKDEATAREVFAHTIRVLTRVLRDYLTGPYMYQGNVREYAIKKIQLRNLYCKILYRALLKE